MDDEASPLNQPRFGRSHAAATLAVLVGMVAAGSCSEDGDTPSPWSAPSLPSGTHDRFGPLPETVGGYRVTRGAAAGYVDDQACRECHSQEFASYQSVGMAQSFYPPDVTKAVEKLGEVFVHEPSRFHYVMAARDGKYYLQRYCVDEQGRRFAEHEAEIAWVMGSGHHARSYLARNPRGELYQMPITWYTGKGWAMSPGYDRADHPRFERIVDRGCMFCHNVYPEVPVGSDLPHHSDRFPRDLPHGIGCQRCHGPGARHIQSAENEDASDEEIRSRITNPANLDKQRGEDLCLSCHLQPESIRSRMMPRSFVRPMYSLKPGDDLTEFVTYLDHGDAAERHERFEINHHGYRLRQSECYTKSAGQLTCVSCHDPHRKVPPEQRAAHYRRKCAQCHAPTDCQSDEMGKTITPQTSDCVACHMVKSRPQDVVHVTTTDHFIRREKPSSDLTAPRQEAFPQHEPLVITPYFPGRTGKDPLYPVYAGFGASYFPTPETTKAWRAAFERTLPHSVSVYVNVGRGLLECGDTDGALALLNAAVSKFPQDAPARWSLGQALLIANNPTAAVATLEAAVGLDAEEPGIHGTLADAYWRAGARKKARAAYEQSLRLRPESAQTWQSYAYALLQLNEPQASLRAFDRAIACNPRDAYSHTTKAAILGTLGQPTAMLRALEAGASLLDDVGLDLVATRLLVAENSLRDPDAALARARGIAGRDPGNSRAQLHLGLAETMTGNLAQAARAVANARRGGADPASCTMVSILIAAQKADVETTRTLIPELGRERQRPTTERLRALLFAHLRGLGHVGK